MWGEAFEYASAVVWNWGMLVVALAGAASRGPPMLRRFRRPEWASIYRKFASPHLLIIIALGAFIWANFSAFHDAKVAQRESATTRDAALAGLADKPILVGPRYIISAIHSTDPEFPHGLKIVVQTDKPIPSPKIVFWFDGNVERGALTVGAE